MTTLTTRAAAFTFLVAIAAACAACSSAPPPDSAEESKATATEPAATSDTAATPDSGAATEPEEAAETADGTADESAETPEPDAATEPEEAAETAPEPAAAARIEVPATKPGLTRIGATKCKMCHKVEYASWEASPHAKLDPPLDCESCHGPGSEYKAMAVMKDAAKAKEAGLVLPGASFCKTCHTKEWKDDMLAKAHAHKAS